MIPYGRQDVSDADVDAVVAVLRSDWLTQGPAVPRFERALAERTGAAHVVAVSNATAGLHLACLAAGVGPGDLVWTTPNTFVASANCARYCGADVDFVDIDPRTWNLDADALAVKLERAAAAGRVPKVVIPVAFGGQSADLRRIRALARTYGFLVVEDASHAVGGAYAGSPVGSGEWADMTVFSFHPVKIVTTGEGGAILTSDERLADRLRLLRSHGVTREPAQMEGTPEGPWYYEQVALGFNYRLTDLQAALGASQLTRLDAFVARRRALAERYDDLLASLPVALPGRQTEAASAWHLYVVRVEDRASVFARMRAAGVGVNVHYMPVHLQPYYRRLGFRPGDFPAAEAYGREALSLPMYAALRDEQQDEVVAALRAAM